MNKTELIKLTAKVLGRNNIRKSVHVEKRKLKITDITYKEETDSGFISVAPKDKMVKYTADDVSNILEAILAVVQDTLAHGESVYIRGLGTFHLKYKPPRKIRRPDTGEWIDVEERYAPKFIIGSPIRNAAVQYSASLKNNPEGLKVPDPIYDRYESPDDDVDEEVSEDGNIAED